MISKAVGGDGRSAPPEHSLSLAGSIIKARYRVHAVSSVSREVVAYMAEDLRHGRPITLKVLRDDVAADAEFAAAVRAQAWTLAVFAHAQRGVARVYECDTTDTGELFVALERTRGVTLREILDAHGAFGAATALRIASRIGEALEALHHNRMLHGQLGADSVLMATDDDGGECVTLVGVELTAASRTPLGVRLRDASGPAYCAPEQVERRETTVATDVYALGVLLRDLVTAGRRRRETTGAGTETPFLPPAIERILTIALDARPEHRYPDISVMVNDMWGAHTALAEPESRPGPVKPRAHTHHRVHPPRRLPVRMAATIVTGGVIALIGWVAPSDRIVSHFRARVTAPPATAIPVDQGARPLVPTQPTEVSPPIPTAGQETTTIADHQVSTPPEPQAISRTVKEAPAVERGAPPIARVRPASSAPRADRVAPPASGGRVSRIVEPSTPAESPAPREQPLRNDGDGSAAVDWLLRHK